jgi:hypothetical protein
MMFETTTLLVLIYVMVNVLKFMSTTDEFANSELSTWNDSETYVFPTT